MRIRRNTHALQRILTGPKGVRQNPLYTPENLPPAFWRWFKKSKVVDEQGRPLIVYHGTAYAPGEPEIDRFPGARLPTRYPAALGMLVGVGAFFSESEEVASSYPRYSALNAVRKVHPVYLHITKPKRYTSVRAAADDLKKRANGDPREFVALLRDEGYDGLTYMEGPSYAPRKQSAKARVWVTFYPYQVKSPDNQGTFDPAWFNIHQNPKHGSRGRRNPLGHYAQILHKQLDGDDLLVTFGAPSDLTAHNLLRFAQDWQLIDYASSELGAKRDDLELDYVASDKELSRSYPGYSVVWDIRWYDGAKPARSNGRRARATPCKIRYAP